MEAQTLRCPNCGAAIASDAPQCRFCESKLATIACPSCFGMMFIGSKHCPHCGAAAAEASAINLPTLKCPRCRIDMDSMAIAGEQMRECETCNGVWLEVASFERICANREEQAAVLGAASPAPSQQVNPDSQGNRVRYSPCPQCGQMMNRINFARCSGVIVDVCRGHGTWFDQDELRAIVEFIREGGLELSREKEKREIAYEREQLRAEQSSIALRMNQMSFSSTDEDRIGGFAAAHGLLKFLIE